MTLYVQDKRCLVTGLLAAVGSNCSFPWSRMWLHSGEASLDVGLRGGGGGVEGVDKQKEDPCRNSSSLCEQGEGGESLCPPPSDVPLPLAVTLAQR